MAKRARWSPRLMPEIRRDMVRSLRADAARGSALAQRALGAGHPDAAVVATAAVALETDATQLQQADLFWVTRDMAQMAMDGALDVPVLSWTDRPALNGLLGFGDALPPIEAPLVLHGDQEPTRVSAAVAGLAWRTMPDGRIEVDVLCHPAALGRRSISPNPPRHLVPLVTAKPQAALPIDLDELAAGQILDEFGQPGDTAILSILSLLAACWTMMMTPTVAQRRSLDGRTGIGATPQTPASESVTIIDLRPLRHIEMDRDETTGRRLTVRHLVRGHWTNQAYGPDRALRRLQWIAPYIKGPADAPLKVSEDRVMVWRRA